jgi:hypothetical protein
MAERASLILGYHDHLPAAAGDGDFEVLYNTRLKPFLTALNANEAIQAALHFSGPLLEKLEQKKPEFFLLIGDLVDRKQVELLGGGFYEPLLPLLPTADKIGQVELYSTYIRKRFGKKPQGTYLPFGAWEQSLTGILGSCGMAYTFLGEEQFRAAGVEGEDLYYPWITEDQGKLITVFPALHSLDEGAYRGRFERRIVTVFPRFTGKNAGTDIGTFLEEVLRLLRDRKIECTLPGKTLRSLGPVKRAYFPSSADGDLMNRVGDGKSTSCLQPRCFLIRYPEANGLYSKMYFLHSLINQLRGDKARKNAARGELWKAQCADAFCRTGDLSISCPGVRRHAWKALISAERITREKANFKPSLLAFDFDFDGEDEYLFQDRGVNCYVKAAGASVFELDYLPRDWNYLDTFGAPSRRCAFTDRLLENGAGGDALEALARGTGGTGRFCGEERYEVSQERPHNRIRFTLPAREGTLLGNIEISKVYSLEKNVLGVSYTLANRGEDSAFIFIPQIDLAFAAGEASVLPWSIAGIESFAASDSRNGVSVVFSSDKPFEFRCYSIAPDGEYQFTCYFPIFRLSLKSGESWQAAFKLNINAAKPDKKTAV